MTSKEIKDFDEMTEEEREIERDKIRAINKPLLQLFEDYLEESNLSKKTIKNHVSNADFYINEFLLYDDPNPMEDGCFMADSFFDFFNYKCLWSSPTSVRGMGASLKKFYKCMLEHGKISKEYYEGFIDDIKEGMPYWIEESE